MADKTAFLVFDLETVSDGRLIQRIRYPKLPELTPAEAVAKYRAQLLEQSNGKSDFVPYTFQVPISLAVAKVGADFALQEVVTLDRPRFRSEVIARHFWEGWQAYGHPTLVTFNGRAFDLPVLELAAFRHGIPAPGWFNTDGPSFQQPRNRFNPGAHFDLYDVLTNYGATSLSGGLNLCAQLLGKPGKMGIHGGMVQELWEKGEGARIDDYCQCDTLDTYFVFLRMLLLLGRIDADRERELVQGARAWIAQAALTNPALAEYLATFSDWQVPAEE